MNRRTPGLLSRHLPLWILLTVLVAVGLALAFWPAAQASVIQGFGGCELRAVPGGYDVHTVGGRGFHLRNDQLRDATWYSLTGDTRALQRALEIR